MAKKGNLLRLLVKNLAVGLAATAVLTLGAAPGLGQESAPDVGLITQVAGEVTFWNPADRQEPTRPQSFMKVRRGDHFKLPAGATLQMLYFANGRQETWKGPVTVHCGDTESVAPGEVKPEVKLLPSRASQRLMTAPLPLSRSAVRYSGAIQTMAPKMEGPPSAETRKKIAEAEELYRQLAQQAAADDVTPELYYLGVLAEHSLYQEMEAVVDAMLAKRPGDPALKDLKAWVRALSATKPGPQDK